MPKSGRGGKRAGGGASGVLPESAGWTQFRPGETALNVMDNARVGERVELHSLDGQNATYELTQHTRMDGKIERRWDKVEGNIDNDYLSDSFGDSMAGIINNTQGLQARKRKKTAAPSAKVGQSGKDIAKGSKTAGKTKFAKGDVYVVTKSDGTQSIGTYMRSSAGKHTFVNIKGSFAIGNNDKVKRVREG